MCVLCTLIARSWSEGGQWWPSPMREAQWSNPQDSPTLSPHGGWLVLLCAHDIAYLHPQSLPFAWVSHKKDMYVCVFCSSLSSQQTKHLVSISVLLFGSCHLILSFGSTNAIQIVRRQWCLLDNVVDNSGPQVYGTTGASYGAPSSGYGAPSSSYAAPSSSYGSRSNYDYQVNRQEFCVTVSWSISVHLRKYFVQWNRNIRFSLCLY